MRCAASAHGHIRSSCSHQWCKVQLHQVRAPTHMLSKVVDACRCCWAKLHIVCHCKRLRDQGSGLQVVTVLVVACSSEVDMRPVGQRRLHTLLFQDLL